MRELNNVKDRFSEHFGDAREQGGAPGGFTRVWSAGAVDLNLLEIPEAEETGTVSPETLEDAGWPVEDGPALLEVVPVLPLVGLLDESDALGFFDNESWPDTLVGVLVSLPCTSHLVLNGGFTVRSRSAVGVRLMLFDVAAHEEAPRKIVAFGVRRFDDGIVGSIVGGDDAESVVIELLGLDVSDMSTDERLAEPAF
jgi:hypothetical protein